jgi:hypothetical protein
MRMRRWATLGSLLGCIMGGAVACGGSKPPEYANTGPTTDRRSGASARESVAISVYNSNFGLVREVRKVTLGKGRVSLDFQDVSANIQPESVHLRPLDSGDAFQVLEQNYRYDLISPDKLLEKYVGKQVKVWRWNEAKGVDEQKVAKILAAENGLVLEIDGEVTYGFPGRISFPELPANLMSKPTLVWLLGSAVPEARVELSYLTRNLNWSADYVFTVDADDKLGDLTGWVTLTNNTGTTYENATLKLVAGDVQRVTPPAPMSPPMDYAAMPAPAASAAPQFREEGLFEYHLYTLQRPTDLLDKEQKQVSLLEAKDVGVHKRLVFAGQQYWYRSQYGEVSQNQKVSVFLEVENTEKNRMGMPLPKGIVRVYKADKSGAKQFIGEDRIDHTPRDEKVRVKMGEAFDVVGDRKQMRWTALGSCSSESEWTIELRNSKDRAERVEVREPVGGDWTIVSSSHPAKREDAQTFSFDVPVGARSKVEVKYVVRVRYC